MSEVKTVQIPDIGGSTGVEVIEILVRQGQEVSQDDPLITLESDKASMDIPCPDAGLIEEILVKVGDKVSEGDSIVRLSLKGANKAEASAPNKVEEKAAPKPAEEKPTHAKPSEVQTFSLPDLGTDAKVEVIEWQVNENDSIEQDGTLLTLESDKASMDVPVPFSGVLVKRLVQVGDKVSSGMAVAEIRTSEAKEEKSKPAPAAETAPNQEETKPTPQPSKAPAPNPASQTMAHAGPGVRRLAHQLGVDLTRVKGTGRKDRITYEDVHHYVKQQLKGQGAGQGSFLDPMPEIDFSQWGEIEVQPLNRIKKLTAKNLHRNWVMIPHVTQFDEADITELEAFRKENKASAQDMGIALTPLAFLIKACVSTLKAFPQFNASLAPNQQDLIYKKYFHIGVAVDTPNGLVVPVIQDADRKGVFQIAKELGELSHLARQGQLKANQMKGSCFTVSSLGAQGGTQFTPIINAPDVAILGVSRSSMKPVYEAGQFVPRLMLPLALSYDHRVIDGVEGAKFMRHLCAQCEDIRKLLL